MVKEIKRIYVLSDLKNYGPFHTLLGDIKHKNLKTDCRHIDITADRINIITLCKIRTCHGLALHQIPSPGHVLVVGESASYIMEESIIC